MSPKEFVALQEQIGCTGQKLAEWMGVSEETVSRWRTGRSEVSGPAEGMMKALATGWRP